MKKYLFVLLSLFLSGCNCILSQIPAQYIYIGENCQAIMPSFLDRVHATDNCVLASLVQTPAPGTILTSAMMINPTEIKATDNSGNSSKINFDVILIDTVPPVITVDDTLLTADYEKMESLYKQGDRILKSKVLFADATFPYAEIGITTWPDSVFFMVREIRLKDDNPTKMYMRQE